jgi:hypothetical protein
MTSSSLIDPVADIAARDPDVLALLFQNGASPVRGSCRLEAVAPLAHKALQAPFKRATFGFERMQIVQCNHQNTAVVLVARGNQDWSGDVVSIAQNLHLKITIDESEPTISSKTLEKIERLLLDEFGFAARQVLDDALSKLGSKNPPVSLGKALVSYLDVSAPTRQKIQLVLEKL